MFYREQPGVMLEPDHPLLERFQKLLKQQLERQISKLAEEVTELVNTYSYIF